MSASPRALLRGAVAAACLAARAATPSTTPAPPPQDPPQFVRIPGIEALPTLPARLPVYFPPVPPVLGGVIDRVTTLYSNTWDAPEALAPYVGEPFYAPLGTHLAEESLGARPRRRLDAYRARRLQVVTRLKSSAPSGAGPDADPTSGMLESEAEELRQLLATDEVSWNQYRTWTVGPDATEDPPALRRQRVFLVLRAASYYTPGLSPAQRRLLLEFVLELQGLRLPEEVDAPRAMAGATIFFLPEMARITVPAKVPAAVRRELDEFLRQKHELKRELAFEVIRVDRLSASKARHDLEELARRHAPRIAELEARAEAIRGTLPALDAPASTLPPGVVALAARYRAARQALQDELRDRLRARRRDLLTYRPGMETLQWNSRYASGAYIYTREDLPFNATVPAWVDETPQQQIRQAAATEKLREVTLRYSQDTAARLKALEGQRDALFRAVARALGADDADGPLSPETSRLAAAELVTLEAQIRRPLFADYETAVLRPGFSAPDRRVLFNHAIQTLGLPLPAAVRRPVGLFE